MTEEPPTGCLVILMPLSAGMAEDVRVWPAHRVTADGEPEVCDLPRGFAARFLADELIDGLVNTLDTGYAVPLDVTVLGYQADDDGAVRIVSLLPAGEQKPRMVPLRTVAATPAEPRNREGDPRKWIPAAACEGTSPAAAALAAVYQLVAVWLTGRFAARPPVVIHCTDGEGLDEAYTRVARSLGLLATVHGPARLMHVGFAVGVAPTLCGQWADEVPEPWAGLMELSAELPAEPDGRPVRRAVSVNDWTIADAWSAIFDFTPADDTNDWAATDSCRFLPTVRELWTHKMGNAPTEWEDAYASDAPRGVAAVSDGASTGIYCRIWADELVKRYIADRPDLRDPTALGKWVHGLRAGWRETINYPNLNYFKQRKVDETGAAATLLGLEVGPLDAKGNRPWRACAVGDASLFWVRDQKLVASFPVVAADQFGSAPLLVRSNPGFRTVAVAAAGMCRPGDRFLLATDAVAARFLKSAEGGPGPDWEQFETIDADAWRQELDELRKAKDMVNDDCTLVVLRVAEEGVEVPPALPPTAAVEQSANDVALAPAEIVGEGGSASPIREEPAANPDSESGGEHDCTSPPLDEVEENHTAPSPAELDDETPTTREDFSEPTDNNV